MPITVQHTPVGGVAELARRGGQQQQAVREQGFQFQQDLIGLQANLQQKRDIMLEGFQQQATLQAQQYETTQQERKYQWLNYQTRQDRKFQEEMAELQIEQYKERQKFDVKLENEQYVAKRKFDFDLGLEAQRNEFLFESQLEQQKIMGDLAEQQMKQQQEEREWEAIEKAIDADLYLNPEENARAKREARTKRTLGKDPKGVGISTKALQMAASTGQDPQFIQDMMAFSETLPNDLVPAMWDSVRNPQRRQEFMKVYKQRMSEEYGLVKPRETVPQRVARGVPRPIADNDRLVQQWDAMDWPQQQAVLGQMGGVKAVAQQQVTGMAKEAERQEHLRAALEAENRATRNYHLKEAGINPSDLDIANRLIKEHDKAWSRYNSAYKEWVREEFDINEPRKGQEDRESRLRTRFTEAATDMNRIETQLKQLSSQFQGETIRVVSPEGVHGELPISEWEEYKKRGFRKE